MIEPAECGFFIAIETLIERGAIVSPQIEEKQTTSGSRMCIWATFDHFEISLTIRAVVKRLAKRAFIFQTKGDT